MSTRSTGALTPEQHQAQDERYAQNHEYDYVFIGAGNAALSAATLLAKAGEKVCLLEAHDRAGGYAHTFTFGKYSWCAQIHYVWGAQPGGKINQFLTKLGLEKDLTFELFDPKSYDWFVMPDGKKIAVPYGLDNFANNLDEAYPGHRAAIDKFFTIVTTVRNSFQAIPPNGSPKWKYLLAAPKMMGFLKYRSYTMQDAFNEAGLPIELQTVLAANAGDYGLPPKDISIIPYVALMAGYDRGAYYPTKHFGGYIGGLVKFIEDHGGHFYYETRVSKINTAGKEVTSVETADGKTFTARKGFICNMDPQAAAKQLIGIEKFPRWYRKRLDYPYSPSGTMVYLGLKDIDLKKYGFGKWNFWHFTDWDVNTVWDRQEDGDFSDPWFFVSTGSMHSSEPGVAPAGHHIMEITSNTNYNEMKELYDSDRRAYVRRKNEIAEKLIDQVERFYIPDIREHIAMKVVGSPLTNERYVMAPEGNAYGAALIPSMMKLSRPHASTPFKNFYWCNATSGGAGLHGTTSTGMNLYMQLTGDRFVKPVKD